MQEHEFEYELGLEAKDKVTGFKGIITWRVNYLTGCDQYGLQPPVNDKGEESKGNQFDANRIEIISEGVSKDPAFQFDPIYKESHSDEMDNKLKKEKPKKLPGGPQPFAGK